MSQLTQVCECGHYKERHVEGRHWGSARENSFCRSCGCQNYRECVREAQELEPEFSMDFGRDDLGAWILTQYKEGKIMIKRYGGPRMEVWIEGRVVQGTKTGSVMMSQPVPQSISR